MPVTLEDIQREREKRLADPAGTLFQPSPTPEVVQAAPAGVTLQDIQAERQRRASAAPPEISKGPMLYGAVQGLADIANLPETISSLVQLPQKGIQRLLGRALPESVRPPEQPLFEPPKAGPALERQARAILNKVGIPAEDLDPDTRTEQFIQRVVREVTGTIVGLPAVRALSAGARALPLARHLAGEVGMAAAQGTGAAIAQQVAPGNLPAEIAGQLAPNAAGLVRALAKNIGTRIVPDPDTLRKQVTLALSETMGDPQQAERNLQQTLNVQGAVPGLQPTLAEATGAPGLIALQRSQRAADPALAGRLTEQRHRNIDTVTDTLDEMFQGDAEAVGPALERTQARVQRRLAERTQRLQARAQTVQEAAEARVTRAQARINERVEKAQGAVREQTAQLVKGADREALDVQEVASMEARRLYEQSRRTFRTEARRAYENVDPEDKGIGIVGKLHDRVEDIARRSMLAFDQRDLPASLRDFQRSVKARATQPVRPVQIPESTLSMLPDDQLELQQFIRRQGGINLSAETDLRGEFEALTRNRETGTSGLFRLSGGLTPQQMAERAREAGFLFDDDKFELLDSMRESMKTGKSYSVRNATAFGDPIDNFYMTADEIDLPPETLRDVDVSINDLQRLRSHILRDARAQTGPDAGNRRRILGQFREAVESRMEEIARESGHPDIYQRLEAANRFYRQNINKFSTGAGERILRQRNGRYGVSNAEVIGQFLRTPEDAAQFVDGIGNRDDALAAIEQYLDAEVYLRAVDEKTGRIKTDKLQTFLRQRNPMLRMFPELRERYATMQTLEGKARFMEDKAKRVSQRVSRHVAESEELAEAQEKAASAAAREQLIQQRLAREPGQAILKNTLDNGGIAQMMGRSDANTQLIRLSDTLRDNPDARMGIGRAMWQEFLRREGQRAGRDPVTDNPLINDRQLDNFVRRYSTTLNHLYGAEHVSNLKKVAEGLRISRSADRPPVQMGSPTAELLQGQRSFLSGAARTAMPISMPVASLKLRLLRFAGRQALNYIQSKKEDALRQITEEILYDPDISKTFAMLRDPKTARQAGTRLKAHMLMLGADSRFDDPEQEE
jgi:hypothetical protein